MDYEQLAAEVVRALRGRRSQTALARRLGYRSNVIYLWESRRAFPTTARALWMAGRLGHDLNAAITRYYGREPEWLQGLGGRGEQRLRRLVARMLDDQRGRVPTARLARSAGFSRFALRRWLSGEAQPRLHEFLAVLDAESLRVLDFIAAFVDPALLPSAAPAWARIEAARHAAYALPWSNAILHALELRGYAELPSHVPGWLAAQIAVDEATERECLRILERAGQIEFNGQRYRVHETRAIDTRTHPVEAAKLKRWWASIAAQRVADGVEGHHGYNLFTCARKDVPKLIELQRSFYRELRRLVAVSEPAEVLLLAGTQLLDLSASGSSSGPEPGPGAR